MIDVDTARHWFVRRVCVVDGTGGARSRRAGRCAGGGHAAALDLASDRDGADELSGRDAVTSASRSRSRSRRGWCSKPRRITRSRSISTERRSPPASDWNLTQSFETKLPIGPHVLAAVATNEAPGRRACWCEAGVLPLGQGVPIHSNSSWRTSATVPPGDAWTKVGFDDSKWSRAQDLGALGTGPWGAITSGSDPAERFRVPAGFQIADGRLTRA